MGEVMEKFQKHFPNTTVEVEVPDVLLEVPMDAMLIEQVLYNLMENAVIHGMAEKIRIRVDAGKHRVRFSVSDDGAGSRRKSWSIYAGTIWNWQIPVLEIKNTIWALG